MDNVNGGLRMKKRYLAGLVLLETLLLTSCASVAPLSPAAERVQIFSGDTVPKVCQLKGSVAIQESNIYGPSHLSVQERQINALKEQAAKLGANTALITKHNTKYYPRPEYLISEGKAVKELDAHAMSGKAYRCPSQVQARLSHSKAVAISDVQTTDE